MFHNDIKTCIVQWLGTMNAIGLKTSLQQMVLNVSVVVDEIII